MLSSPLWAEETEDQRGEGTCPGSGGLEVAEWNWDLGPQTRPSLPLGQWFVNGSEDLEIRVVERAGKAALGRPSL